MQAHGVDVGGGRQGVAESDLALLRKPCDFQAAMLAPACIDPLAHDVYS